MSGHFVVHFGVLHQIWNLFLCSALGHKECHLVCPKQIGCIYSSSICTEMISESKFGALFSPKRVPAQAVGCRLKDRYPPIGPRSLD